MGLSPILVDAIFRIIRDINAQGTTILLVEQNARMALRVAHRGYVMQTGRIVLHDAAAASCLGSREEDLPGGEVAGTPRPTARHCGMSFPGSIP